MRTAGEVRPRGASQAPRRLALVAALLLLAPAAARAQATLEGGRGTLLVPDADPVPLGHGTASLSLSDASGTGVHAAPLGLTFGIWNGVDLGATLLDGAAGDPATRGAARDIRLRTKWRFAIETARRPALAFSLQADHLLQGVDLSPSLVAHKNFGALLLAGELGYRHPGRAGPLDPAGPFYGAALSYQLSAALTASLQAAGESGPGYHALTVLPTFYYSLLGPDPSADLRELLRARGLARRAAIEAEEAGGEPISPAEAALPPGAGPGQPAGAPAAALPAVSRGPLSQPGRISFFVAAGPTYGSRSSFRAFAGVQISTFDEQLVDSDRDGIPDRLDRCPYEPEDWDGYQDEDGCPDHGEEAIRKEARARAARQAAEVPRFGTDVPRFRMAVPMLKMPVPGAPPSSSDAPMYQPLDRPAPAPATPAAPSAPAAPTAPAPRPPPAKPAVPHAPGPSHSPGPSGAAPAAPPSARLDGLEPLPMSVAGDSGAPPPTLAAAAVRHARPTQLVPLRAGGRCTLPPADGKGALPAGVVEVLRLSLASGAGRLPSLDRAALAALAARAAAEGRDLCVLVRVPAPQQPAAAWRLAAQARRALVGPGRLGARHVLLRYALSPAARDLELFAVLLDRRGARAGGRPGPASRTLPRRSAP